MTQIKLDISEVEITGSVMMDVDISTILEDASISDVMEAVIDQFGYGDIVSEMNDDELLGEVDRDVIFSHITDDPDLVTDCIEALWNDANARAHLVSYIAEHVKAFCDEAEKHDADVEGLAWKALVAARLGAQVGLTLTDRGKPESAPQTVPAVNAAPTPHQVETMAKLDLLEKEIRAIKEGLYADPHKA